MNPSIYTYITNSIAHTLKTPQYLILFVSNNCWTRCRHCWFNETWKSEHLHSDPLSFNQLEKLSNSIKKIAFLSITGGEAFLREDIVEIVNLFTKKRKVMRFQIPTSGFNTSLIIDHVEKIIAKNSSVPFRVDVSLDGSEKIHDFIRNTEGSYKNAINTIIELNKIKQKCKYFDVGVITTISSVNQDNIDELSEIVSSVNSEGEWMINIVRGTPRNPSISDVKIENYFKAHDIIQQKLKNNSLKGHRGHLTARWLSAKNTVRRNVIKKILMGQYRGGGCAAGSLGGVIYSDGSVYPCEMLDKSFGNLKDFDFQLPLLWNSKKADIIRKEIQHSYCQCTQECFHSINFLIQPLTWLSIIKERFNLK